MDVITGRGNTVRDDKLYEMGNEVVLVQSGAEIK